MGTWYKVLRAIERCDSGATMPWGTLAMALLLAGADLAIETTQAHSARVEVQRVADIAALAAVRALPDQRAALAMAGDYAAMEMPDPQATDGGSTKTDVFIGRWDSEAREFRHEAKPVNAIMVTGTRAAETNSPIRLLLRAVTGESHDKTVVSAVAVNELGDPKLVAHCPPADCR